MPFSHHSHSGQFCPGHAKDQLEETIQTAISQEMRVFCLSEHMPREKIDFYPEETFTEEECIASEAAYFQEALRLRDKFKHVINIPIGFETDWIRPSSLSLIERSLSSFPFDFFVGSVHHVYTIPVDYDVPMYRQARELSGGTDEQLFEAYFDDQLAMLQALKPPVVGHMDLIRLKSDEPDGSFTRWPQVWQKILRNLDFIAGYGGLLELNSASLRKGMSEPYPKAEICKEFMARKGRFCLSDDSHGVEQVGLNYHRVLAFLRSTGISTIHYLRYDPDDSCAETPDCRFPHTRLHSLSVEDLEQENFWKHVTC
ncbi:histidinol-phosphatase [Nannizzia gypsea CBS 118893]|uniref:Histidinol-phosphatase n=1 Tax=Arthroderma gypseum (strain ATCC MYA-4604 / CBS 118893) TaxID=535722 RepID=E4V669_ARTGP|nr:histidinol-phosphatase [Nannizzia gypsea CBS 118893]EFR05252.1 histidinol-phosphatase [Nannizzia gypsea CBS 118893]